MIKRKKIVYTFLWILSFLSINVYAAEDYPKRIISLGPAITENLYLLGVQERIVGTTTYCIRPAEAAKKRHIATIMEVNTEEAISLQPDLILATNLTNPRAAKKLGDLGIKVVSFTQPKNFSEVCAHFTELAEIVGKEQQARQIIQEAQRRVADIKVKADNLPKPKVFIEIGARPLFAATEESFINDFVELNGAINIAAHALTGIYSREEVLRNNPDVIIIAGMGIAADKEKADWCKYKSLSAVKSGRIYIVDPYKFCSPTPLSFTESLEEVFQMLYGQPQGDGP